MIDPLNDSRRRLEYIRPHFKFSELQCPCCARMNMPDHMLDFLERARRDHGQPWFIESACRCGLHNSSVGGKISSFHLQGLAVDIVCPTDAFRHGLVKATMANGANGIIVYPKRGIVHVDLGRRIANVFMIDETPSKKKE